MYVETKKCKHCQSDIPKKAKVCPVCRKNQNHTVLGILILIIGVLMFSCGLSNMFFGSSDDRDEVSSSSSSSTSSSSSASTQSVSKEESNSKRLTAEKFNAIDFGMSYEDVVEIVGEEGENISEVAVADMVTSIYQWSEGLSNFNVTIQDGYVTAKAQAGIITSSSKVTMEMYNNVENGMTYDEVVALFESEGTILSTAETMGVVSTIYTWNGTSLGANCNVTFQDGKVFAKAQLGLE